MRISEKAKINSEKALSYFSQEPQKKSFSQQNSMTELCRTLFKYGNKRDMG